MDKSRVCMSRTINLAKQKNVNKTTQLVYEKCSEESKCRKPSAPKVPGRLKKYLTILLSTRLKMILKFLY